jgi:hypothetical protein
MSSCPPVANAVDDPDYDWENESDGSSCNDHAEYADSNETLVSGPVGCNSEGDKSGVSDSGESDSEGDFHGQFLSNSAAGASDPETDLLHDTDADASDPIPPSDCDVTYLYDPLIELLKLKQCHSMSNKCFKDLLKWSNRQRKAINQEPLIPEMWLGVQKLLKNVGFVVPKPYYICMHDNHPCHFSILEDKTTLCKYRGRPEIVKYYYLSVINKVKAWVQEKDVYSKLLGHWKEQSHWLQREGSDISSRTSWGILGRENYGMVTDFQSCLSFGIKKQYCLIASGAS